VIYINFLLSSLKEVCKSYPLQEKVLIVPGYRMGHELCEALAGSGVGWVNLRPEAATGLAHLVAGEELAEKGFTFLPGQLATAVVEEVYHRLEKEKSLLYFARESYSPGLVRAIASSIGELRYHGVTSDNLRVDSFVSKDKGQDMVALLKAYEHYLADHKFIDAPGTLSYALDLLAKRTSADSDTVYLLPSFLQLAPLERRLIELLSNGRLIVLAADPVYGLSLPGMEPAVAPMLEDLTAPLTEVDRLPWLYQIDRSPEPAGDGSLSIFYAYGLLNEVREIFRCIIKEGISLDRVVVAYTSSDYIPVIYSLARRLGLNVTYGEGIPGNLTAPGRVLKGLVEWIRSGYSVRALKALLLSGDVVLPGSKEESTAPSPAAAARLLAASGIGWGRDRYILLKQMAETLKEKAASEPAEEDDAENRRQQYLRRSELAEGLYTAVHGLLTHLPLPDQEGRIGFRELTSSLSSILPVITKIKSIIDAAALQGLINNLIQAGQFASFNLETEEALERVENILGVFRAGASGPRPGHLHVVSYENLIWSCRPHTFIAGLGADNFPGSSRQDPVLLDGERRLIHSGLALGTDRPIGNQYMMALALASRRGRVTLSFPSFDVVENRAISPSNILLQAYRLLRKDTSLDYTDLSKFLGSPAGYCPHEGTPALDETEWWIGKVLTGPGVTNGEETVRKCYRGIEQGRRAIIARQSPDPTEYDGMIDTDGEFDPRWNNGLVLSSSRIEELAGCPFAYFLKNILRVLPPDELSYDPNCWLNPLERGSLLHEVFCRFMQRIIAKNESPSLLVHRSMLMEMADELIVEYKKRIPVPNDFVFQREVRDIHRSCEVFLAAEETHADGDPVFFEVPFGMGSEALAETGQGLVEPVKIYLGDGSWFFLRGKIDRIDRAGEGVYHVWDYKTGRTYGFDEHRHFRGGRQIQHALYAIAAEQIIKGLLPEAKPRVTISGYYFPTERGEGLRICRHQQDNREQVAQLLNNLFDILAEGIFVAADDGERCGICDYRDVCGGEVAVARAKELASPEGSPLLDSWRRLKKFG